MDVPSVLSPSRRRVLPKVCAIPCPALRAVVSSVLRLHDSRHFVSPSASREACGLYRGSFHGSSGMVDQWYYGRSENKLGPYSSRELRDLAIAGTIRPTDTVWKAGIEKGVAADKVKNLFAPTPADAVPPPVEPPAEPIAAPP